MFQNLKTIDNFLTQYIQYLRLKPVSWRCVTSYLDVQIEKNKLVKDML